MAAVLSSVVQHLDNLLSTSSYRDYGPNGLQIDGGRSQISTVAYAVDSGLSVLESAVAKSADLILVHHGLFWGKMPPLTGTLGAKVRLLMQKGCSLYASHLPLDGHIELGNAAQLAKLLEPTSLEGAYEHEGKTIGVKARWQAPISLDRVAEILSTIEGSSGSPLVLSFGKREISTAGIVTGSGGSLLDQVLASGVDLFITGEPKQELYHQLKEHGVSAVFAGHYATETFGVRALAHVLSERFRVDTIFINEPTGI